MKENPETKYKERGYLRESFQIFHLSDHLQKEVPFHYHEFLKIFVLIHGNISYIVEGNEYELHPYDIVLIDAGEIHRPIIHDEQGYERIIIYLSPDFLTHYPEENLQRCFQRGQKKYSHVIRYSPDKPFFPVQELMTITNAACEHFYAGALLQKCRLLEFLILLNNAVIHQKNLYASPASQNENVQKTLHYINSHLTKRLSISDIADAIHLNRSYLMHKFKEETGYTVREFVIEKRLFLAGGYIKNGMPLTEACYRSGFSNYSSFYRAYVKKYGYPPKEQKKHTRFQDVEVVE